MGKVINVGVIGCGRIAQMMHLPYLQQLDEYNLYSVCDISAHVVDEVGRLFAVDASRRFTDIDAMLSDPALEAVIICTKDHYEPAIKAAKAGKHMIVEKPLAYNVRQAREMIEAAKENKVIMMVGYMKRYDPGFVYALNQINKLREEKAINFARVHCYAGAFDITNDLYKFVVGDDLPKEILDKGNEDMLAAYEEQLGQKNMGYARLYAGIIGVQLHVLVLLRQAFGKGRLVGVDVHKERFLTAIYDCGDFCVIFEAGAQMLMHAWDEKIEVFSHKKNITIEFTHPYFKNQCAAVKILEDDGAKGSIESLIVPNHEEEYICELRHFYDCITNGKIPYTTAEDAIEDLIMTDEMVRMAAAMNRIDKNE